MPYVDKNHGKALLTVQGCHVHDKHKTLYFKETIENVYTPSGSRT